ncbi:hypothetical protein GEMRC1_007415 [Eukaryota sp. GEM-RC1]
MDPFVIIIAVVVVLLLIVVNYRILLFFEHPDDKGTSWWAKTLIQLSFLLAEVTVLLLPLDIVNARNPFLPMDMIWQIIFLSVLIFASFIIPFSLFWYESIDEFGKSHPFKSFCFVITVFFFLAFAVFVLYAFFGFAEVPITVLTSSLTTSTEDCPCVNCVADSSHSMVIPVTFPVYIIACFTLLGWLLFVLFGSVGIAALPLDLLNSFRKRPRKLVFRQYAEMKAQIADRATRLYEIGSALNQDVEVSSDKSKKSLKILNKFKQQVILLEQELRHLQIAGDKIQYSPFKYWFNLVVALCGLVVSVSWAVHIFLYLIPSQPIHPF